MKKNFLSYVEARDIIKPKEFKTKTDWTNYLKSNERRFDIHRKSVV
jgi:hypothetical protein